MDRCFPFIVIALHDDDKRINNKTVNTFRHVPIFFDYWKILQSQFPIVILKMTMHDNACQWHVCQVCLEGEILQDYSDIEVVACNALDIVRGYKRIPFYIELFNVQKSYARLVL